MRGLISYGDQVFLFYWVLFETTEGPSFFERFALFRSHNFSGRVSVIYTPWDPDVKL